MTASVSSPAVRRSGPDRRIGWADIWLVLVVFVGAAYFYGGASWNHNARLDAIFTFVEPGPHRWTFRLDPFLPDPARGINTGDWTRVGDHYYANKAPGTMLLGVLVYLPIHAAEEIIGADLGRPSLQHLNAYLINLGVTVLPLAIAVASWSRLFGRQTGAIAGVGLALLTFFGTLLFPYATQLWGHTTAAAFVMLGIASFDAARLGRPRLFAATGLFIGLAVLSDFLAVPVLVALTIAIIRHDRWQLFRFGLGGSGPALLLLGYQWYCFGNPFHLPTDGTNPMFVDDRRALGLFGWPSGVALFQLTVGPYRGLFLQMPVLLAAPVGFRRWWRRDPADPTLWVCLGSALVTLLWVSTFNGWHGGASVSARYLIVILPLVALALRELTADRWGRRLVLMLAAPSLVVMLAIAGVGTLVSEWHLNPLFGEVARDFLAGELHPRITPIRLQRLNPNLDQWGAWTAWNWGDLVGLAGLSRLLPWVMLVATGSALACLSARDGKTVRVREGPRVPSVD